MTWRGAATAVSQTLVAAAIAAALTGVGCGALRAARPAARAPGSQVLDPFAGGPVPGETCTPARPVERPVPLPEEGAVDPFCVTAPPPPEACLAPRATEHGIIDPFACDPPAVAPPSRRN